MNSDSLKPVDSDATESQTPSAWDPFTVWHERVHKPRAESTRASTVAAQIEPSLTALRPVKQRG